MSRTYGQLYSQITLKVLTPTCAVANHASGDMRFVRMSHIFIRNVKDLERNGQPPRHTTPSSRQKQEQQTMSISLKSHHFLYWKILALPAQVSFLIFLPVMKPTKSSLALPCCNGTAFASTVGIPNRRCRYVPEHTVPGVLTGRAVSERLPIIERVKNILSRIRSYLELLFIQRGNKTFSALDQCKKGQYKLQQLYIN